MALERRLVCWPSGQQQLFSKLRSDQLKNHQGEQRYRAKSWLEIDRRPGPLRMIRLFPQQSVEKRFSRRFLASAVWLDGHKDCIDFSQLPWVVQAKHPPAIGFTIHVQNAEVHRMRFSIGFGVSLAPYLEGAGIPYAWLVIKVESVKN